MDRRHIRSDEPTLALTLFLQAEARRRKLRAIAVGTSDGLPIASWGNVHGDELAAVGTMHAAGDVTSARREIFDVSSVAIDVLSQTLIVTSCGGKAPRACDIADHIQRIMA